MSQAQRTEKGFKAWISSPKPTEWLTTATVLLAAVLAYANGVFDAKKTELETRKNSLEAANSVLELQQMRLEDRRSHLETTIAALEERNQSLSEQLAEQEQEGKILATQLRKFVVPEDELKRREDVIAFLRDFPSLQVRVSENGRSVWISHNRKDRPGKPLFLPVELKTVLEKSAEIEVTTLHVDGMVLNSDHISTISLWPKLSDFDLENCDLSEVDWSPLSENSELIGLHIVDCELDRLPPIRLEELGALDVRRTPINPKSFFGLAERYPQLKTLWLVDVAVDDEVTPEIARLTKLQQLVLHEVEFTSAGFAELLPSPQLFQIVTNQTLDDGVADVMKENGVAMLAVPGGKFQLEDMSPFDHR